jgi:hypothetical protein
MNRPRYYLISAILACLLASCNDPYTNILDRPADNSIPEKSSRGADYVVCLVDNDLNPEVYREDRQMMFDEEDVRVRRYKHTTPNGDQFSYEINADRNPENETGTSISLSIAIGQPEINKDYKLNSAEYFLEYFYSSGQYRLDSNISRIRFSRVDTVVVAGEFLFRAVDQIHDTIIIRGYFDIPFEDK